MPSINRPLDPDIHFGSAGSEIVDSRHRLCRLSERWGQLKLKLEVFYQIGSLRRLIGSQRGCVERETASVFI